MAAAAKKLYKSAEDLELILQQAKDWVTAKQAEIPTFILEAIFLIAKLRDELKESKAKASSLLEYFRRELGISPKSEKGQPSPSPAKPKHTDEEKIAALKERRAKLLKEIRRYEDRLGKGRKKRKTKRKKSAEAKADNEYAPSNEALFTGNPAEQSEVDQPLKVNRMENYDNPRGLHSASDDRVRHEHAFTTKTIRLSVETVTDPRTGKSVTASTDEIGPPNSQTTWNGIANTIISVIGYAIPINRLSTILSQSNPYFTSARLCSQLELAAKLFAPIYIHVGEQLADCDVLMGDDTKARVIEIAHSLANGGELADPLENSLIEKVANAFGRVFPKKKGDGNKRSYNVSVVIGKPVVSDPRSYIFFFRSHLGTYGDLVSKILESRKPSIKNFTVLTDLSNYNLLSPQLYQKFQVTHAGCTAHARRPF